MGMNDTAQVHVIGGGLAGMAAAAFLARAGHGVTVHESRNRLGGRGTTDERDGFRFNQGPHALYRGGPAEEVLGRLGVRTPGTTPAIDAAQAMIGGHLELLPTGPVSMLRTGLLGARDKVEIGRLLSRLPRLDATAYAGHTVDRLLDELTTRPRSRQLARALVRLTSYADLPGDLSGDVAIVQLQLALSNGVSYLHGGWERLVDQLAATPGIRIERGERLEELPDAPAVIVAVGGPEATAALTGCDHGPAVAAEASVLDLGLDRPPAHDFVLGIDEARYLSNHGAYVGTPAGRHSVSLAAYLGRDEQSVAQEDLRRFARRAGFDDDAVVVERYLHRMTVVSAVATAERGGLAGRPPVTVADRPGVFVAGDWVGPRGHLLDAVLASAESAAQAAATHLARRPAVR